jgi:MerR family transcriptional regulator, light-induced transcriptional regulator
MDMFEQPAQARRRWDQADGAPFAPGAPGLSQAGYMQTERRGRVMRPDRLALSIEAEIVPRLLLSRRSGDSRPTLPTIITVGEVAHFADLVLTDDTGATTDFIDGLRARGIRADALFLDLLGPSAVLLGDRWTDDICSFGDVTLGVMRLKRILRDLVPVFHAEVAPRPEFRRALLVPAPGEQHGLGLQIVAEFLRRAGWSVWCGVPESRQTMLDMLRQDWFAMVGLSTACTDRLESLSSVVRLIRRASRNPAIGVMVGGPVFIDHPELAAAVGADATAVDGRHAAQQAENVLDLMPSRG